MTDSLAPSNERVKEPSAALWQTKDKKRKS